MCGIDILQDPETDEPFPAGDAVGSKPLKAC